MPSVWISIQRIIAEEIILFKKWKMSNNLVGIQRLIMSVLMNWLNPYDLQSIFDTPGIIRDLKWELLITQLIIEHRSVRNLRIREARWLLL